MTQNTQSISTTPLTLALAKGRLLEETLPLLKHIGATPKEDPAQSRKLILPTQDPHLNIIVVRAADVAAYVHYGAADIGVLGLDMLLEYDHTQHTALYRPIDLGIGRCRLCVAASQGSHYTQAIRQGARIRVATKYVHSAREHFAQKGVHVDLIHLYGSMELAPLVGLADAIVDLVSTGTTLRANRLEEVETIRDISARLIVNPASLKRKHAQLRPYLQGLDKAVKVAS